MREASPVRLEVLVRAGSRGAWGRVSVRGDFAALAVADVRISAAGLSAEPRGKGLRMLPTTTVMTELMPLIPPREWTDECAPDELRVPWESAAALGAESTAADFARDALGWNVVPELVESLLTAVTADCLVTTSGVRGATARWWISGDGGWVGLGFDRGEVVLVPSTHDDIAQSIATDLAMARTGDLDG